MGNHICSDLLKVIISHTEYFQRFTLLFVSKELRLHTLELIDNRNRLEFLDEVVTSGNFKLLKWAHKYNFPWSDNTTMYAAENGYFEILKWLRKKGCGWDHRTSRIASYYGYFEMLKWVVENGCGWDPYYCKDVRDKDKRAEIIAWIKKNEYNRNYNQVHVHISIPALPD